MTEQEVELIAQGLEERPEVEYSKLIKQVQAAKKMKQGRNQRGKHGPTIWWNTAVPTALQERKAACRQHRTAVRAQQPGPVRKQLWDTCREKKNVTDCRI